MKLTYIIITCISIFLIGIVSASSFGYNYLDGEEVYEGGNYTINVNYSEDSGMLQGRNTLQLGDYFEGVYGWLTGNIFDQNLNTTEEVNFTGLNIISDDVDNDLVYMKSDYRDYQGEIPSDVPSLYAWYDFTDESSLTLSGDEIEGVDNKQGNANYDLIPVTATNTPNYVSSGGLNDLGYASFTSANQEALGIYNNNKPFYDAIGVAKTYTIFIVTKLKTGSYCHGTIFGRGKTNVGQGNSIGVYGTSAYLRLGSGESSAWTGFTNGNWYVINSRGQTGDIDFKYGLEQRFKMTTFNRDAGDEMIGRTYDAQCNSPVPASYGHLNGDISEIILYNSVLSDDNYEKVMAYLEDKYGQDYVTMTYHNQQDDYIDIEDSSGSNIFNIDKAGKVTLKGDIEIDGDIIGNAGLSVEDTPIGLYGTTGNPAFSVDGSGGISDFFDMYDKSSTYNVFRIRDSTRTHMRLSADIGRVGFIIDPAWDGSSVLTYTANAVQDYSAPIVMKTSTQPILFTLGYGNTWFTDQSYYQYSDWRYNHYKGYKVIIQDRPLYIENSSSIVLGYNATSYYNITFTENELKIDGGNVTINGNLNVSGCINYNGGTLGTCI